MTTTAHESGLCQGGGQRSPGSTAPTRRARSLIRACLLAAGCLAILPGQGEAAVSPAQKCESQMIKATGKYVFCLLKAESKFSLDGDSAKRAERVAKCDEKLGKAFDKADQKFGAECPVTQVPQARRTAHDPTTDIMNSGMAASDGFSGYNRGESSAGLPRASTCGDAVIDPGEACDDGNLDNGDGCNASCGIEDPFECTPGDFQDVVVDGINSCVDGPTPVDPSSVLSPLGLPSGDYEATWVSGCINQSQTPNGWGAQFGVWPNGVGTGTRETLRSGTANQVTCEAGPNDLVPTFYVPSGASTYVGYLDAPSGAFCFDNGPSSMTVRLTCARFADNGDGTVTDHQENLQWEVKDSADGSPNAGNPHDVDNRYWWARFCSISGEKCQPSPEAEDACTAQTESVHLVQGCHQCGPGEGTCESGDPGGITTVWQWVADLNASNYAGHSDWRLATVNTDGKPGELNSIIDPTQGDCGGSTGPCIDPIFGPTIDAGYWAANTDLPQPFEAYYLAFQSGANFTQAKAAVDYVRAVRDLD